MDSKKNYKWLQRNREEMEQSIQHLLKLVEEDGKQLLDKHGIELHSGNEELVAHVREFHRSFSSLADKFYICNRVTPSEFDKMLEGSESGFEQVTPMQHKNGNHPAPLSSVSGFSFKDGSESSCSSSSDSESDDAVSSLNNNADSELNLKIAANGSYEDLLGKVVKYEEELNVLSHKSDLSGVEIDRLKSELEKANTQLKSAQIEIDAREAKLELARIDVVHLKERISYLETYTSESDLRISNLIAELEESRASLQVSDDEIALLNAKLGSETRQVSELKEEIAKYKANLSDAQTNFSETKAQLQSEINSWTKNCALLAGRVGELESQGRCLEDKLRQYKAAEMEMKSLHDNKESEMLSEINQLKEELGNKGKHVEVLNKDFDKLKLKYDMLMTEKDEFIAKADTLIAEVSHRDNRIMSMEEHLNQLSAEKLEMGAMSERERKRSNKLKVRVDELEKEVDMQKSIISDRAEEKREAIRQLCFSLDHYRSEFKELKEAFRGRGYKRQALMAA